MAVDILLNGPLQLLPHSCTKFFSWSWGRSWRRKYPEKPFFGKSFSPKGRFDPMKLAQFGWEAQPLFQNLLNEAWYSFVSLNVLSNKWREPTQIHRRNLFRSRRSFSKYNKSNAIDWHFLAFSGYRHFCIWINQDLECLVCCELWQHYGNSPHHRHFADRRSQFSTQGSEYTCYRISHPLHFCATNIHPRRIRSFGQ